jgi:hypothetical protein
MSDIEREIKDILTTQKKGWKCKYKNIVSEGFLYFLDKNIEIKLDTEAWFSWLVVANNFRFESEFGNIWCYKDEKFLWKAHQRKNNLLRQKHLGESGKITEDHLLAAAIELNSEEEEYELYQQQRRKKGVLDKQLLMQKTLEGLEKKITNLESELRLMSEKLFVQDSTDKSANLKAFVLTYLKQIDREFDNFTMRKNKPYVLLLERLSSLKQHIQQFW